MAEGEFDEDALVQDGMNVKGLDWIFDDEDPGEEDDEFLEDDSEARPAATRDRDASVIKGLLWNASIALLDSMFDDLAELTTKPETPIDQLHVLGLLPARFAQHYSTLFARRFLVAIVDVTRRIAGTWSPLPTVAHELALRLLLIEAEVLSETFDIELPAGWRADLEQDLFEDLDHEFLYDDRPIEAILGTVTGMAPMDIHSWFVPFSSHSRPSPYATDIPEPPRTRGLFAL